MSESSYQIQLSIEDKTVPCPLSATILAATLSAGIDHTHACGGQGNCSTCRVSVMEGLENCHPRNEAESSMAQKLNFPPQVRLACQTTLSGDISMRRMILDQLDMEIVDGQFEDESGIAIGSQEELTMLFIDVVNYTALAERFPPYDIVHVLNRYYRMMNSIIKEHNGIISDVAGDGILAVFGTSANKENSVCDAIEAVEAMRDKLEIFNHYMQQNFDITFGIRAGVHYGSVIVGPFDTGSMRKLAVIGDNVNYASRVEFANKQFGTDLLLSEEAYNRVSDKYKDSKMYETTLKGKTGSYRLYAPLVGA